MGLAHGCPHRDAGVVTAVAGLSFLESTSQLSSGRTFLFYFSILPVIHVVLSSYDTESASRPASGEILALAGPLPFHPRFCGRVESTKLRTTPHLRWLARRSRATPDAAIQGAPVDSALRSEPPGISAAPDPRRTLSLLKLPRSRMFGDQAIVSAVPVHQAPLSPQISPLDDSDCV
ncbi:hypothetical protein VTJ49DRAFT_5671 [Mycothermus thermophilus]|uniref:Uncharacterized protein n=1 Tax=Humicola insolens TaxID=85995 RepID=A0ABR3VKL1_HUMIN